MGDSGNVAAAIPKWLLLLLLPFRGITLTKGSYLPIRVAVSTQAKPRQGLQANETLTRKRHSHPMPPNTRLVGGASHASSGQACRPIAQAEGSEG